MLERRGDLWMLAHELKADAVAITTNGFVKDNGHAALVRGSSLQAAVKYPWFPEALGISLKMYGLRVQGFRNLQYNMPYTLVAFPIKPDYVTANDMSTNIIRKRRWNYETGVKAPGWAAIADIDLIVRSCGELMSLVDEKCWNVVLLVRPGCAKDELSWKDVKNVIQPILDDRVIVVSR